MHTLDNSFLIVLVVVMNALWNKKPPLETIHDQLLVLLVLISVIYFVQCCDEWTWS